MHFPALLLFLSLTWASTSGISLLSPLSYFTSGFRSLANYKLGTTARLMSYITGDRAVKASVNLKIAERPTIVEPDQVAVVEDVALPPSAHVESQILPIPQEVLDQQIEEFKKHFESGYAVLNHANGQQHQQQHAPTLTISLPLDQYKEFISAGTTGGELMRVAVVTQDLPQPQYSHVPAQHWHLQQSEQQQFDEQKHHQQLLHQYQQQSEQQQQSHHQQYEHESQQQQFDQKQHEQHQHNQQLLHQYQQHLEQQQQQPQSQLEAPPTEAHSSGDQYPDHTEPTELAEDSQGTLQKLPGASSSHSHVFPYGQWVAPELPMSSLEQIPSRLAEFQSGLQRQASQVLQQIPSPVAPNLFPLLQQQESPAFSQTSTADAPSSASNEQDVVIPGSQFPDIQELQAATNDVQSEGTSNHNTEMFGKPNVQSPHTSAESPDSTQASSSVHEERRRRSASDDEPTPTVEPDSTEFSNATVPDDQVEEYFQFIRAHDEDQCLARLICMMSTEPNGFGAYAKQIDSFFRAYSPRSSQQSAAFYKEAATASRSNEDCATRFAQCQMDSDQLKKAVNL
ncbi:GATA zinc finger domain-containing protein 10 [Ixodes scapularis]